MKKTWLVVLLIVLLVAVLGFLIYLSFFKKDKVSEIAPRETATPAATGEATQKARALSDALLYPGSTMTEPAYSNSGGPRILLQMKTIDYVDQVSSYYVKLAQFNNWELGSQGVASDKSGGWLNIEQDDFTANIQITRADNTTSIEISIYYDSEMLESSVKRISESANGASAPSPVAPAAKTSIEGDFVFGDSGTRELAKGELSGLSDWQLKVARNEIYARHGREFVHNDLKCHFAAKSWYEINSAYSSGDLSALENKNVALILNYEKEINSSLLAVDSGCEEN